MDIPITTGGSQVSGRVYKGGERGIEKGARRISKGNQQGEKESKGIAPCIL